MHRGPDAVIVLIFFFSGLILNARQIRSGLMDIKGIAIALSIILQVSLFPQYGMALMVCVLHHMIHLLMEGYLVGRLKGNGLTIEDGRLII